MTPPAHVVVEGLSRRFDAVEAVRALSFEVASGELFGVVGPDGAGKTTLLRMLAGVLRPTAGDATIGGTSVARHPERVKPRLAYMSQRFGLYSDLTVAENLAFYADLHQVPRDARAARLAELDAFSGLGPFRDRLAGQLSGGMKQKLSLSCALVHQPPFLLLDEPTSGVDPLSRRDLWLIVHRMVAGGTTVIVSTAYLDEAERCDRVLLLHHGRRLALAPPRVLQAELAGRIFVIESAEPDRLRRALAGAPGIATVARFGTALHVSTTAPTGGAPIREALGGFGAAVRPVEASLEDVFVARLEHEAGG